MMIKDFFASITLSNEYDNLKNRPFLKILAYQLVLSLVFGLLTSAAIENKYKDIILMLPKYYDSRFPEFSIKDSKLQLSQSEKTVIEENNVALIFDTSQNVSSSQLLKYKQGIVFSQDNFMVKTSANHTLTLSYKQFNLEGANKKTARDFIGAIPSMMIIFTVVVLVLLLIVNLFMELFFALIFKAISRLWKKNFTFLQTFKISTYTATASAVAILLLALVFGDRFAVSKYLFAYYLMPLYLIIVIRREGIVGRKSNKQASVNKNADNKKTVKKKKK